MESWRRVVAPAWLNFCWGNEKKRIIYGFWGESQKGKVYINFVLNNFLRICFSDSFYRKNCILIFRLGAYTLNVSTVREFPFTSKSGVQTCCCHLQCMPMKKSKVLILTFRDRWALYWLEILPIFSLVNMFCYLQIENFGYPFLFPKCSVYATTLVVWANKQPVQKGLYHPRGLVPEFRGSTRYLIVNGYFYGQNRDRFLFASLGRGWRW